jgi:hypothetical protein
LIVPVARLAFARHRRYPIVVDTLVVLLGRRA